MFEQWSRSPHCWLNTTGARRFSIRARGGRYVTRLQKSVVGLALHAQQTHHLQVFRCCLGKQRWLIAFRLVFLQGSFISVPPDAVCNYMFLEKNVEKHKIYHVSQFPDLQKYKQVFAWVLADVVEYSQPKVLPRKKGQIVWAKLSWDLSVTLPLISRKRKREPMQKNDCQNLNAKESIWNLERLITGYNGVAKLMASLNVMQLAIPWPGSRSSCCRMSRSLFVSQSH